MSCNNITTLLLSDTFNTWFERTNETISALNAFEIKGLSANDGTDFKGLKLIDQGSCLYNLNLSTGPFVGFYTTSGENGIYGTGDASSPYNLTLIASGPTMDAADVTADDQVLVSDTNDDGRFKLAPVTSFITNIVGGNNISIVFANNTYTISYVELSFSPSFSISGITASSSSVYEITETPELRNNEGITFNLSNGGNNPDDVHFASGTIALTQTSRVDGFDGTLTFLDGDSTTSDSSVSIPYGATSWFNESNTIISFVGTFVPQSQSEDGTIYSGGNATVTRTIYFGWRFGGCHSTTEYDNADTFSASLSGSLDQMEVSNTSTKPWDAIYPSSNIYRTPSTERFFDINVLSNQSYIYFVHTDSDSGDGYGWEPELLQENGSPVNDGLTSIGFTQITLDGRTNKYQVWRSGEKYNTGLKKFGIR